MCGVCDASSSRFENPGTPYASSAFMWLPALSLLIACPPSFEVLGQAEVVVAPLGQSVFIEVDSDLEWQPPAHPGFRFRATSSGAMLIEAKGAQLQVRAQAKGTSTHIDIKCEESAGDAFAGYRLGTIAIPLGHSFQDEWRAMERGWQRQDPTVVAKYQTLMRGKLAPWAKLRAADSELLAGRITAAQKAYGALAQKAPLEIKTLARASLHELASRNGETKPKEPLLVDTNTAEARYRNARALLLSGDTKQAESLLEHQELSNISDLRNVALHSALIAARMRRAFVSGEDWAAWLAFREYPEENSTDRARLRAWALHSLLELDMADELLKRATKEDLASAPLAVGIIDAELDLHDCTHARLHIQRLHSGSTPRVAARLQRLSRRLAQISEKMPSCAAKEHP